MRAREAEGESQASLWSVPSGLGLGPQGALEPCPHPREAGTSNPYWHRGMAGPPGRGISHLESAILRGGDSCELLAASSHGSWGEVHGPAKGIWVGLQQCRPMELSEAPKGRGESVSIQGRF